MNDETPPKSSIILYRTEDGRTRIQCRFEDETIWLTQKLMGELFQKDVRTINEHVQNIFAEGELAPEAVPLTDRKARVVPSLRGQDQEQRLPASPPPKPTPVVRAQKQLIHLPSQGLQILVPARMLRQRDQMAAYSMRSGRIIDRRSR